MRAISFADDKPFSNDEKFVVDVGKNISTKADLLEALASKLGAPSFYGRNWDSLLDMLRDLSWIKQKQVAIFHSELPQLDDESVKSYLGVLSDALNYVGRDCRGNRLQIIFPAKARELLSSIVN